VSKDTEDIENNSFFF